MTSVCGMHTMCKRRGVGSAVERAEGRGLSLRVERDERVGVWWLDEVDVSVLAWCQTLCHCQCQPHQPIPNCQPQSSVFQSHCVCCHFNQCVGAAVLSHFCPLSNILLIGNCHLVIACIMSCLCWVGLCVLRDVKWWSVGCGWCSVCLAVHFPKKGSTAHGPVCMWWCAPMRLVVVWWCGGCREIGEEAKTESNKNKKGFSQNHFFPFPFFSSSFSSTLFSLPSTLPPSLPSYPYTHLFFMLHMGAFMVNQKHQWPNIWFISLSFLFVQTLFFSSFPSANDSMLMKSQSNTIKSSNNTHLT